MSENLFEAGSRKMIPAVLVYVQAGKHTLMIHRDSGRKLDYHLGKWNGLGGKLEADESALEAAQREVKEESGLDLPLEAFRPLGTIHFPNFKAHKSEDWMVFVFVAEWGSSHRLPELPVSDQLNLSQGSEGSLHWIPSQDLTSLNLWPGDIHFLPYVQKRRPFMGTIWYEGQKVKKYSIQGLADDV